MLSRTASVPSLLPSLTNRTSVRTGKPSSTSESFLCISRMPASSLNVGTMIDTRARRSSILPVWAIALTVVMTQAPLRRANGAPLRMHGPELASEDPFLAQRERHDWDACYNQD